MLAFELAPHAFQEAGLGTGMASSRQGLIQLKKAHEPVQTIGSKFLPRSFAFYSPIQVLHFHWFPPALCMHLDMFTEVPRYRVSQLGQVPTIGTPG